MLKFNLLTNIIHSLLTLFFSTQIHININGHISRSYIIQQRGVRQDDPISPLLFNIAFDPFLRSVHQNPHFKGFDLSYEAPPPTSTSFPSPLFVKILAYADDTLVYLQNSQDFMLLQQAILVYMQASKALLNYHKTVATSLSGKPSASWSALLTANGIHAWHDRTSLTPLIYLGYNICSNITQRNVAYQKLYDSIRNAVHIHSQCQLSIRGRATVINRLIYFTLWHVMRLTTLTKAQLLSLRSLGAAFINRRIFPIFSFDTLSQPQTVGGVGLLDPLTQQQALQWHWVCPILLHSLNSLLLSHYTVFSLPIIIYALSWFYYSSGFHHFRYYMLFPSSRRRLWFPNRPLLQFTHLNPFINLQACVSKFPPVNFDTCYVNALTCLSLPFYDILLQSLPTNHPSFHSFIPADLVLQSYPSVRQLLVSDVFLFDLEALVISVRSSFRHVTRHPTVSKSVAMLISSHQLQLKPFFLQQCTISPRPTLSSDTPPSLNPFFKRILAPPSLYRTTNFSSPNRRRGRIPLNSIRYFKQITASFDPINGVPFGPLPFVCLRKLFGAEQFMPNFLLSRYFILASLETIRLHIVLYAQLLLSKIMYIHFLFSCPFKLLVWQEMCHSFICTTPFSDTILLHHLTEILFCKGISVDRDTLPFLSLIYLTENFLHAHF
ncbi:hypothetical protein [Parasitella parasitica]|uniref:Reverse transcriptase domain-containing protein n=1 Tax=Parasitella parasitica TaxID=35722 RepID=A0A0B7NB08_9FUNG|nr:hypothetical protein [Parasitella parasitica]